MPIRDFRTWFRQQLSEQFRKNRTRREVCPQPKLRIESLEERALLATYIVTDIADSGPGTLRQAILDANGTPGVADEIQFNIPGAGPHTIAPTSSLPTIVDTLTIDGRTQPGYAPGIFATPQVRLDGGLIVGASTGLTLGVGAINSEILALSITGFSGDGLFIQANAVNASHNYIGVTPGGIAAGNTGHGVALSGSNSQIGFGFLFVDSGPNVISANSGNGVRLTGGAGSNFIGSNRIGTDPNGTTDLGNTLDGVNIDNAGINNIVLVNLISGNNRDGISINATNETAIAGNMIGLRADGTSGIGNGRDGIRMANSSQSNIGGPESGLVDSGRNYISGNTGSGINFLGTSTGNKIKSNYIGVGIDGASAIPNIAGGILLASDANTIGTDNDGIDDLLEGNLIARNGQNGLFISGNSNVVAGNTIQNHVSGSGVLVEQGDLNTVGGVQDAARNIIGGNSVGVTIGGLGVAQLATQNYVLGNYIGLAADGLSPLANGVGIVLDNYSSQTRVGQKFNGLSFDTKANVISSNSSSGIVIDGAGTAQHTIHGNLIGTDATGQFRRGNEVGVRVSLGANHTISENVISGNYAVHPLFGNITSGGGILVDVSGSGGPYVTNLVIDGNKIGTSVDGLRAISNYVGIRTSTIVGTYPFRDLTISNNLLSGNWTNGLQVYGQTGFNAGLVDIHDNVIGLDSQGESMGNARLFAGSFGSTAGAAFGGPVGDFRFHDNVVSGNFGNGIEARYSARVQNNLVGLDPTGRFARENQGHGITTLEGVIVGTDGDGVNDANEGNTISGNYFSAISTGSGSNASSIRGNRIGTDVSGTLAIPNSRNQLNFLGTGIDSSVPAISAGKAEIGTNGDGISDELERNIIAGNLGAGISIDEGYVAGNWIGVDASGTKAIGNRLAGVIVNGTGVRIGSNGDGFHDELEGNVIGSNGTAGVQLEGTNATIRGNWIGTDPSSSFSLGNFGNGIQIGTSSLLTGVQGHTIGRTDTQPDVLANVIAFNSQAGIRILGTNANNTIGINRYLGSGTLAIDAGSIGVTPNTTTTSTSQQHFPVLTDAYVDGNDIVVRGFVRPGATTDIYLAGPNPLKFGDGIAHLFRGVEGSVTDTDSSTGTYDNTTLPGLNLSNGVITANRFSYRFPRPDNVQYGSRLTAVHVGATGDAVKVSEFGNSILVGEVAGFTLPGSSLPAVIKLPGLQTIQQGQAVTISGSFTDYDSTEWTGRIQFGDGNARSVVLREDFTFEVTHTYSNPGNYVATMSITDNALSQGTASMPIVVQNVAPEIDLNLIKISSPVNEGNAVRLTGVFEDAKNTESHLVTIQWGDGISDSINLPPGTTTFSVNHSYPSRGPDSLRGAGVDLYRVSVTVSDPANASDATPIGLLVAEVRNVVPSNLVVNLSSTSVQEGQAVTLTGSFDDPGLQDLHQVRVDWGDGTTSTLNRGAGVFTLGSLSHTYTSKPRIGSTYDISVELLDLDSPSEPLRVTRQVVVTATPASNVVLTTNIPALNPALPEGGLLVLGGSFTHPNLTQVHRVEIDWGDGSPLERFTLGAGVRSFAGIPHVYRDNPETGSSFTITTKIIHAGTPSVFATASKVVVVTNAAPSVGNLSVSNANLGSLYREGDTVTLTGNIFDDGFTDRHTIAVAWGDGTTSMATVDSSTRTFTATHRMVDQSTQFVIQVTDDDGGTTNVPYNVSVLNLAPKVRISPSPTNSNPNLIELLSIVEDVPQDTNPTYSWTAQVLGNPAIAVQTGTSTNFTVDRTTAPSAVWSLTLAVDDGDGGQGAVAMSFLAGTAGNDILTVSDATFASVPSGALLVLGLAGQDTLDGSGVTNPNHQLILDGGADTDALFGGAGDDIFFLRQGNDSANSLATGTPANASIMVLGSDRYFLVPNSTLSVYDTAGTNALDFGLASFGITFDLSVNNGTTLVSQDVDPTGVTGAAGQHFVATQGIFAELRGGAFADTLTAASASYVFGGVGNDTLKVKANTSGASLSGGADDDSLIADGIGIANLRFDGDDGLDSLENLGTITGLTFSGGADDDSLFNDGFILGILSFDGDDGIDSLTNFGDITTLTFGGGADDDSLINEGSILGSLSFDGDDGLDSLENLGTIIGLTFAGGADDDSLINDGIILDTLSFDGDDGLDSLINNSNIDAIVFRGGADDDSLLNDGLILVSLRFDGDDGLDSLINNSEIATLTFNGGADDDSLINDGPILGSLTFDGDDGLDSLANYDSIASLTFTGGADDDSLLNQGTLTNLTFDGGADDDSLINELGSISTLSFHGDFGSDTLRNHATATLTGLTFIGGADDDSLINLGTLTTLSFDGDDGVDSLLNEGTLLGSLTFTGGADDDYLINLDTVATLTFNGGADDDSLINLGSFSSLTFNGGADDDSLENRGIVLGSLSFDGDDGLDSLENLGNVASLTFSGGADDDSLENRGLIGSLSFDGDDGLDSLENYATASTLTFTGGADDDSLINSGLVTNLTFDGGADDDSLLNQGASLASLSFDGDTGIDILINRGNSIGSISFTGGADDDYLVNLGNGVGHLTFDGGADDDTLIQRGTLTGSILFTGDNALVGIQGTDTFVLHGNGTAGSSVVFDGMGGKDILQNNAASIGSIEFLGGSDDDVLQNFGVGIGNILFEGDIGSDILDNNGAGVLSITFTGGADDDYLLNEGAALASLTFQGGSDDDFLINVGNSLSNVLFQGDVGLDLLFNRGANVVDVRFVGGADDDSLINEGIGASNLSFDGDAGADRFINRLGGASSTGLVFNGDSGADLLINSAIDVGTITFVGGADDDYLLNEGASLDSLSFNGDDGMDRLVNTGNGADSIQFDGGADDDVLVNSGRDLGQILFQGDLGADRLQNNGNGVGGIEFIGGADDDLMINNGVSLVDLLFTGDDGSDFLQNNASFVSNIRFTGGADDDDLQNNGNFVGTILVDGGSGSDRLLNNGDDSGRLELIGGLGSDSLISKGNRVAEIILFGNEDADVMRVSGEGIGTVSFEGGDGTDSLIYEGSAPTVTNTVTFSGGDGNDLLAWLGIGSSTLLADAGSGDDTFAIAGNGSLTLAGGAGNDHFVFQGRPEATVAIAESLDPVLDASSDTLDFSAFSDGPLNLDLRSTSNQPQGSRLSLSLSDSQGIENVFGTHGGDTILGNARNNAINGAEYMAPEVLPVASRRAEAQWVYLDFDSATEAGAGEHIYTPAERAAIQASLESVYHGTDADPNDSSTWWFYVRFTQDAADLAAIPANGFATIVFNETPLFQRPGGEASEVDLGNLNLGGRAVVQVNGLLGGQLALTDLTQEDSAATLDNEESDIKIGARKPIANSSNFIALSAKIAAHELGHLLGLRHYDTYGPIGFGVHTSPGSEAYNPIYTGPAGAYEAINHLLSSGASIGTDRFNDLKGLFFGEREAVKLAYATSLSQDVNSAETTLPHHTLATAQPIPLATLQVPNTLLSGLNQGKVFDVKAGSVLGSIQLGPDGKSESDFYQFSGRRGELVNIEVSSLTLRGNRTNVDLWADTLLRVTDANGTVVSWFGGEAFNDDEFESSDSAILDLVLPYDGDFFIEIDTFARLAGTPSNLQAQVLRAELEARLSSLTTAEQETLARLQDSLDDTDIGTYQLFLYKFDQANASDDIDHLKGNGGFDSIDGGPGDNFDMLVDLGAGGSFDIDTPFQRTIVFSDRAASSWVAYVNYGDASPTQPLTVTVDGQGNPTFALSHSYSTIGVYTITVEITNDLQIQTVTELVLQIENLLPSVQIESIADSTGNAILSEGSPVVVAIGAANHDGGSEPLGVSFIVKKSGQNYASQSGPNLSSFQFTPDDNDLYEITVTVTDTRGKSNSTTETVDVSNVNPTIASVTAPSVGNEGGTLSFAATANDPGANENLQYAWNFGNGATATGLAAVHAFGDNGTYTVTLTVTDKDGGTATTTRQVNVSNVNPTITSVTAPSVGNVGETLSFAATANDPGANESLQYAWNFGNGVTSIGANLSFVYSTAGTYVVTLIVTDKDGGASQTTRNIVIQSGTTNQVPTLTVQGRSSGVRGQSLEYTLVAQDPDPVDQNGLFTYTIQWGDGSPIQTVIGGAVTTVEHVFVSTSPGYPISVRATDARGATSTVVNRSVSIVKWQIQSDPLHPGEWMLVVGGTMGNDEIEIERESGNYLEVEMNDDEACFQFRSQGQRLFDRILVYAQGGNDEIEVDVNVELDSILDGGSGNDRIEAGRGNNILIGGDGDDRLYGQQGNDLIIGGRGSDQLYGGSGEDLLIAGYTSFDHHRRALEAIMAEWSGSDSYSVRRNRIRGTSTTGSNQGYYLVASGSNRTVFDDQSLDRIWGEGGQDWYFANLSGGVTDQIYGKSGNEANEEL